jgi:c-di-AMP phosphodiesterase-like protein
MIKENKKKMEFSKKIFYMITVFTVIVIIYSMALMWKTNDSSALAYLIPSVFTELATCTGFYFWKARKENEIKILKKHGSEIYNETINNEENKESEE